MTIDDRLLTSFQWESVSIRTCAAFIYAGESSSRGQ